MKRAMALGGFAAIVLVFLTAGTSTAPAKPNGVDELPVVKLRILPTTPSPYELLKPRRGSQNTQTYDAFVAFDVQKNDKKLQAIVVSVQIEPGMRATQTGKYGDYDITLTAGVDRERKHAKAEVTMMRNGVRVHQQESEVVLYPTRPDGNIPLR